MSQLLLGKLESVRRKGLTVALALALGRAATAATLALSLEMFIDYWFELPYPVRAVLFAAGLTAIAWWLWNHALRLILSPWANEEVALWVERAEPSLAQRVISVVQLAAGAGVATSSALLAALVAETEALVAPKDLRSAVDARPAIRWSATGSAALLVLLTTLTLLGPDGRSLLLRAAAIPGIEVPRKTRVDLITPPGPLITIARGDDLTITARARGVIPPAGQLELRWPDGTTKSFEMSPNPSDATSRPAAPNEYAVAIQAINSPFTFRVHLNDGYSPTVSVEVADRPSAKSIDAYVTPPPYAAPPTPAGQPARTKKLLGDLVMLQGSQLDLSIEPSPGVENTSGNQVQVFSGTTLLSSIPLTWQGPRLVTPATGITATKDATGIAILLVNSAGITTKDPTLYRLEVIPDRPPTIRVTSPTRKEDLITRMATIRIGFEAADDIGLAALRIRYAIRRLAPGEVGMGGLVGGAVEGKLVDGPPGTATEENKLSDKDTKTIDLDIPPEANGPPRPPKSFKGYYLWKPGQKDPLAEGTIIEWWVEAQDANNITGPGRSTSDHFLARIGTEAQVRDALMTRVSASFGTLEDTRQNQQDLAGELGKLIREKAMK